MGTEHPFDPRLYGCYPPNLLGRMVTSPPLQLLSFLHQRLAGRMRDLNKRGRANLRGIGLL